MSSSKLRKISKIVKEIAMQSSQSTYDISGLDLSLCKFYYRVPQNLFKDLASGDYTIDTSNSQQSLIIQNNEVISSGEAIQVCYEMDLSSSKYEVDFEVDINRLTTSYNELVEDVHTLWEYIRKTGMIADDTTIDLILPQLNNNEVWVKSEDGYKGVSLTDAEGIIKSVIEEYTNEMKKVLDNYVEDPLKPRLDEHVETVNKPELDRYVEETNKPTLDDYTTQLEERLQTMIDQAVADKGLMPESSDWFEIALGNWLVVDLFNKNYTNYPSQLNLSDNAGVVKKDITDGGKSQIIRYYTTTGKMFFAVRVNEVWSEWQELGEQSDTMQFTQANHGFVFTAVALDGATRQWVKANKYTSADGIAIKIDSDRFDVVTRGVVNIPTSARDDKGEPFVYDEYYFLSQEVDGGFSRTKNETGTFQYLAHISEIDGKQVAYIDIGDSYDLDYEVVDTETADRIGIGTYKTTLRTADTIEDLKRLNLKEEDVIEVLGYYTAGDGAGHKRIIANEDDGSGVQLRSGKWANYIFGDFAQFEHFGAKGDGITDDTLAFEKAINYKIISKPNKKYAINVNITKGIDWDFSNSEILPFSETNNNSICLYIRSKKEKSYQISESELPYGTEYFTVTDNSGLKIGDIGYVTDYTKRPSDNSLLNTELIKISDIKENKIYVYGGIRNLKKATTSGISFTKIEKIDNVNMKNVVIKNPKTSNCHMIHIYGCENIKVTGLRAENIIAPAIDVRFSNDICINDVNIKNSALVGSGQGYGISILGCKNTFIQKVYGEKNRHTIDLSESYFVKISDVEIHNELSCPIELSHNGFNGDIILDNINIFGNNGYIISTSVQGYSTDYQFSNYSFRNITIKNVYAESIRENNIYSPFIYFQNTVENLVIDNVKLINKNITGDTTKEFTPIRIDNGFKGVCKISNVYVNNCWTAICFYKVKNLTINDYTKFSIENIYVDNCLYVVRNTLNQTGINLNNIYVGKCEAVIQGIHSKADRYGVVMKNIYSNKGYVKLYDFSGYQKNTYLTKIENNTIGESSSVSFNQITDAIFQNNNYLQIRSDLGVGEEVVTMDKPIPDGIYFNQEYTFDRIQYDTSYKTVKIEKISNSNFAQEVLLPPKSMTTLIWKDLWYVKNQYISK